MPQSRQMLEVFLESRDGNPSEMLLAICLKEDDRHVGNLKIGPINWIHRFADLGIVIGDTKVRGCGLATEAVELLCKFARERLNLRKLYAGCYSGNLASKRVFEKAGFSVAGILKDKFILGGRTEDHIFLERTLLINNSEDSTCSDI